MGPVEPMYMAGLFLTASRPPRTFMDFSSYELEGEEEGGVPVLFSVFFAFSALVNFIGPFFLKHFSCDYSEPEGTIIKKLLYSNNL